MEPGDRLHDFFSGPGFVPMVASSDGCIGFFRAPAMTLVDPDPLVALEDRIDSFDRILTVKRAPSPCMASPNNRA